jgi:hypothetical protein
LDVATDILPSLSLLEPARGKLLVHLVPTSVVEGSTPLDDDSMDSADLDSQLTDPVPSWVDDRKQAKGLPAKLARFSPAVSLAAPEDVEVVDASDDEELPRPVGDAAHKNLLQEMTEATPLVQALRSKAIYSKRATSTPAVRKSSRTQGAAAGTSALLRAQRLTAKKNLEGKAGIDTVKDKGNDFAILDLLPDEHLSSVVRDSCLVFSPKLGCPGEALSIIRAKEKVQAALAETSRSLDREAKAAAAAKVAAAAGALAEAPRVELAAGEETPRAELTPGEAAPPSELGRHGAGALKSASRELALTVAPDAVSAPTRSRPRRSCAKAPALAVSKRHYKKRAPK